MAEPIIVEQAYEASLDELWRAITERDLMVQWFFDEIPAFEPRVGFTTEFDVNALGRDWPHQWEVLEAEPQRTIAYRWEHRPHPGEALLRWEVSAKDGGSFLRLTFSGIETFTDDEPVFDRAACQGGWDHFVRKQLKAHLDG